MPLAPAPTGSVPPVRVMVRGVAKTVGSKVIGSAVDVVLASAMFRALRSVNRPAASLSAVLLTTSGPD